MTPEREKEIREMAGEIINLSVWTNSNENDPGDGFILFRNACRWSAKPLAVAYLELLAERDASRADTDRFFHQSADTISALKAEVERLKDRLNMTRLITIKHGEPLEYPDDNAGMSETVMSETVTNRYSDQGSEDEIRADERQKFGAAWKTWIVKQQDDAEEILSELISCCGNFWPGKYPGGEDEK